jgi:5-formyltetrahydrofolate cyclo-ligase
MIVPLMPTADADAKQALRRAARARRSAFVAALTPDARTALETSLAAMVAPLARNARRPASYAAQGAEIDPVHIEKSLGPHAFPRVSGSTLFFHLAEWAALSPGFGGIPEPSANAPLVTPDLVLVPLLAATLDGRRLGQGGGFYDSTLNRLRAETSLVAIGLGWDEQIVADLPVDPWDARLDYVATPTRLVDCTNWR